jgi:hypothetical protein
MLHRFSRRQLLAGVVLSLTTAVSPVLGGQRATRIRFTPGASSSTVTGVLTTRVAWRKYVLRANAGQTLTFAVSRTNPQIGVMVYDVGDSEEEGANRDALSGPRPVRTGEVKLPATKDYFLYVQEIEPPDPAAPPKAIKYSLTVEIH